MNGITSFEKEESWGQYKIEKRSNMPHQLLRRVGYAGSVAITVQWIEWLVGGEEDEG
jgi:hypothetical protein